MGHIHNGKQPVGLYTPVADNTKDVGAYEPLVSEVRSDDKDDFDMYVVYKADKQKAKVTYIDLDATGDARILEVQNANPAPATGADVKTTYGVTTLQGKSHTKIPYTTAETIKKYEDLGYELVTDGYTNNSQGTAVEGGRKFDDDKEVDQAFNVYLRHKKVTRKIKDTQEVTRTIEYKYASTDDVPADKRGTTAAPTVTETLHYERDRTIDYTLAAKEYPTEYAAYKAVLDKSGYDSPEEYKARTVYYDHITNKAIAADATAAQKSIVTFGPWTPVGGTSNDAITLSDAEKAKDDKFNLVNSPEVTGYVPDNATIEATTAINAEADDYKVTVLYTPADQKVVVKFVEVEPTNTDKIITPGLADPITVTGKSETVYPTKIAASVTNKITDLIWKGYELVNNGFVSTDKFDSNNKVNQEYLVKLKAKIVEITPNDPTPTKDQPIDPNNPNGPKWTPELVKELEEGRKAEVKRTIKYVYADGKKAADTVEETKEFKRTATINVVTGKITFGNWSEPQSFEAVTSPTIDKHTPNKENVPSATVKATDDDITETVIYNPKTIVIDPNKPLDPTNPNVTPKPDDQVPNDPKGRTYRELGLVEEVTHTVHYKLADGSSAGIPDNVQTLTFTRTVELNPVTGEISNYTDWVSKDGNKTIKEITTPTKDGYIASAKTSTKRENVEATDKDSEEVIIYRQLGSYVPVIPDGATPPANVDLTPKPYEKATKEDPTKPGTSTETPVVPYIPGTTPIGPNGKPLTQKDPNDLTKGYEVPSIPEDPTQNTRITYVKDGSQVALVHFIKADGTAAHVSVAEAGDTGKAIKTTNVDNVKAELKAKGYEIVALDDAAYTAERVAFYAENNRAFDEQDDKGDNGISQVYYVIVKEGVIPVDPNKPLDPTKPDLPKPGDTIPGDPKQRTYEQLGLIDEVNRTINYRYANTDKVEADKRGKKARPTVKQQLRYTRTGEINKVTGEFTYKSDWTVPQTLTEVTSPVIEGYVADIKTAEKVENVTHDATDSVVNVVYTPLGKYVPRVPKGFEEPKIDKPQYPNDPNRPKPGQPIDPNNPDGPKWTEDLIKKIDTTRHVNRTITYVNEKGEEVAKKAIDKVTFTREGKINSVTGEITYTPNWIAKDGDTTFDKVKSPVVKGYILKDAKQKEVATTTGLTADSKDENIEVVYTKLGSWIPNIPGTPTNPITYPNDPADPTKPGIDKPNVPYVPGYIPVGPDGNPLKPVDPNDPTKGYEVPNVPNDPTQNTPIDYIKQEPEPIPHHNDEKPKPEPDPIVVIPAVIGEPNKPKVPNTTIVPEPVKEQPATPQYVEDKQELPNTGTAESALATIGFALMATALGVKRLGKKEEE